jgi:hypothetical protein
MVDEDDSLHDVDLQEKKRYRKKDGYKTKTQLQTSKAEPAHRRIH